MRKTKEPSTWAIICWLPNCTLTRSWIKNRVLGTWTRDSDMWCRHLRWHVSWGHHDVHLWATSFNQCLMHNKCSFITETILQDWSLDTVAQKKKHQGTEYGNYRKALPKSLNLESGLQKQYGVWALGCWERWRGTVREDCGGNSLCHCELQGVKI